MFNVPDLTSFKGALTDFSLPHGCSTYVISLYGIACVCPTQMCPICVAYSEPMHSFSISDL